jgi:hypothetical protein
MDFGLGLSVQHRPDDAQAARFAEHVEQVRLARAVGFTSVWASQHYLAEPFTYFQPIPTLARVAAEAGGWRSAPASSCSRSCTRWTWPSSSRRSTSSSGERRSLPRFRRCADSSAGSARAIEEPKVANADRWGASGGAAVAPPD